MSTATLAQERIHMRGEQPQPSERERAERLLAELKERVSTSERAVQRASDESSNGAGH
jgi:hypothetical protein